jgi:hypothetical protein
MSGRRPTPHICLLTLIGQGALELAMSAGETIAAGVAYMYDHVYAGRSGKKGDREDCEDAALRH